jgi:phosphatidylserine/phosphatidylglycerophosphate/cardiolipin synthase-like enzyme
MSCASSFQITEVYPDTFLDGDADEYVIINGTGALASLELTDGEGTIRFPPGSVSGGSITIAHAAESFRAVTGSYPDYELMGGCPMVAQPLISGRFQLANKKDELILKQDGQVIQTINWPGSFKPRSGQIHYLSDGMWDQRVLMSGASRFEPATFKSVSGIAFVSPDCSRSVFKEAIISASREILVNIYEFTDYEFADLLCQAAARGVKVVVLIEGGPVGGISSEEKGVIARLFSQGIQVIAMTGTKENHPPYRYNHAKYLVIDRERLLLTTENFKEHSFPPSGLAGNRGWGVVLNSPELAAYFYRIFNADITGKGVSPVYGEKYEFSPYVADSYHTVFEPVSFTASSVTPVIAPDTCSLIEPFINNASRRLLITEAYIKHWSEGKPNPYLQAAINASRRGVDVRILLDSYYYNTEGPADNDEMADEINSIADRENLPLNARLIDLSGSGLLKLHAKGVIADDAVFISSINWNENSPVFNREAGLIIEDATIAGYFSSVFELDWEGGSATSYGQPAQADNSMKLVAAAGAIFFVLILYWARHRHR